MVQWEIGLGSQLLQKQLGVACMPRTQHCGFGRGAETKGLLELAGHQPSFKFNERHCLKAIRQRTT